MNIIYSAQKNTNIKQTCPFVISIVTGSVLVTLVSVSMGLLSKFKVVRRGDAASSSFAGNVVSRLLSSVASVKADDNGKLATAA